MRHLLSSWFLPVVAQAAEGLKTKSLKYRDGGGHANDK